MVVRRRTRGTTSSVAARALLVAASLAVVLGLLEPGSRASTTNTRLVTGAIVLAGTGIEWLDPTGAFPTGSPSRAIAPPQQRFYGIDVDPAGAIFALGPRPIVYHFDPDGSSQGGWLASAVGLVPGAIAVRDAESIYVAVSDGGVLHEIYRFNEHGENPSPVLVAAKVTALDVAADGCTILYATPEPGLKRLDWCADKRLPDFATAPVVSTVRALPDGTALATTGGATIVRLADGGAVVRTYKAAGAGSWSDFDLTLTDRPSGRERSRGSSTVSTLQAQPCCRARSQRSGASRRLPCKDLREDGSPQALGRRRPMGSHSTAPARQAKGFSARLAPPPQASRPPAVSAPALVSFSGVGQTIGPYGGSFSATAATTIGPTEHHGGVGSPRSRRRAPFRPPRKLLGRRRNGSGRSSCGQARTMRQGLPVVRGPSFPRTMFP